MRDGVVRSCLAGYGLSFGPCRAGVFRERSEKRLAHAGPTHLAFENVAKGYKFPVQNLGFVFILRNHRSTQIDSRKQSACAGVSEKLRFHLPVSICSSIAADWARCRGSVRSNLELTRKQVLHSVVIGDNHHQVDGLTS